MIAERIHKVAEQEMLDKGETGHGPYRPRPSNSGPERCIRQMVYHAMGLPPKALAGRALHVFDDSKWHEELTHNWLSKDAIYRPHSAQLPIHIPNAFPWRSKLPPWRCATCEQQTMKVPEFWIKNEDCHGHLDWLFDDLTKQTWLFEHKALNHFGFNRIWGGKWPLDYFTQMVFYFRGLMGVAPVNKGLLFIKNKNTAQYIDLEVEYNFADDALVVRKGARSDGQIVEINVIFPNVYAGAIEKFRKIDEEYLAKKVLPARPFEHGTDFPCGYCPYEETCWTGYEEELKQLGDGEINDPAFVQACTRRLQVTKQLTDLKKEKDRLDSAIKAEAFAHGFRQVATPVHVVMIEMKHRDSYVCEAVDYEQVSVKARKHPKEAKDGQRQEAV